MRFIENRSRGSAEMGWLSSRFSFSFADYYDPSRMHFGALRVINDDIVAPGTGFGMHPHRNMEIVTIVLDGVVEHEDNLGNKSRTRPGEIQVMSAGSGVLHSEMNPDPMIPLKLLQIWILPNVLGTKAGYAQMGYELEKNEFSVLVSDRNPDALPIRQEAELSLGRFETGSAGKIELSGADRGVYLFVIEGEFEVNGQVLKPRDALEMTGPDSFAFQTSFETGSAGKIELSGADRGAYLFVIEGEFEVNGQALKARDALEIAGPGTFVCRTLKGGRLLKIEVPLFNSTLV